MRFILFFIFMLALSHSAGAQDKDITLATAPMLVENGFLKYVLPRFSLKTGLSITQDITANGIISTTADVVISPHGPKASLTKTPPLMQGRGHTFYAWVARPGKDANRLVGWLYSDIGLRTIQAFQIDSEQVFFAFEKRAEAPQALVLPGDIVQGEILSFRNCGRCHVIGDRNRMQGLGSTPSFGLLRTFDNWLERFQVFYALNPHPSFSQVLGVTLPFSPQLPPPISPLVLSQDELQSIIAYVATIPLADLGSPLVHQ